MHNLFYTGYKLIIKYNCIIVYRLRDVQYWLKIKHEINVVQANDSNKICACYPVPISDGETTLFLFNANHLLHSISRKINSNLWSRAHYSAHAA